LDMIIAYGTLCEYITKLEDTDLNPEEKVWTLTEVKAHQGPLKQSHQDYKDSLYNVLMRWDDGSESYEQLEMIIKDDPVTLATYAKNHNLLNKPGWNKLKAIARRFVNGSYGNHHIEYNVMANKHSNGPIFPFGIHVPHNVKHAYNGNTK
jgi:hypothetical protein